MKIAVVGLGYWGPNLVRNLLSQSDVSAVVAFDLNVKQTQRLRQRFPMVEIADSFEAVLRDLNVQGVVLSTPIGTHFALGARCLEAGKHLLIEKPITTTTGEAIQLIEMATRRSLVLMVDHTFIYTGAVRKMKELLEQDVIGEILYFDSVRVNLGLFQHDANVIWDLAPHDISIMRYLLKAKPRRVSAVASNHFNGVEDMAYISVFFENSLLAHFHVNWLSPVKVRRVLLGGTKHMLVYDDMDPSEKLKVYDKGVEVIGQESVYQTLVQYRMGNMFAPHLDTTEALSLVAAEFIQCIQTGGGPASGGELGLEVVRILEAAEKSLRSGGLAVEL